MMPAYNAAGFIRQAIDSVLAQTYPHWELVVVDDGSTDGTATAARSGADPRIRVVEQANAGEAAARNHALGLLRGEFVACLDADDRFLPDHLAATVAALRAQADCDGVYTDGYYINAAGERLEPLSRRRRGPFTGRLFEPLVRASDVFGPPICVVLRRAAVAAAGVRFDPQIVIGPDWDFFTRLAQSAVFGYLDRATVEYRVHQTNVTRRVGDERRRLSLARCREKAITLPGFAGCTLETRTFAFYDLLVNLLAGLPERQDAVITWPQFTALPAPAQARMLRLMATRLVRDGGPSPWAAQWLARALALHPADGRARLAAGIYRLSPGLFWLALRARARLAPRPQPGSPFGSLS
jgi:glycosyltransferase involved in cell wall biosynthesis